MVPGRRFSSAWMRSKKGDVGVRVVAGFVHVLEPEEIGFAFRVAAELQISDRNGQVEALIDAVAGPATGGREGLEELWRAA